MKKIIIWMTKPRKLFSLLMIFIIVKIHFFLATPQISANSFLIDLFREVPQRSSRIWRGDGTARAPAYSRVRQLSIRSIRQFSFMFPSFPSPTNVTNEFLNIARMIDSITFRNTLESLLAKLNKFRWMLYNLWWISFDWNFLVYFGCKFWRQNSKILGFATSLVWDIFAKQFFILSSTDASELAVSRACGQQSLPRTTQAKVDHSFYHSRISVNLTFSFT